MHNLTNRISRFRSDELLEVPEGQLKRVGVSRSIWKGQLRANENKWLAEVRNRVLLSNNKEANPGINSVSASIYMNARARILNVSRLILFVCCIFAAIRTSHAVDGWNEQGQTNGEWSAWVNSSLVLRTASFEAQTYDQKLLVLGPGQETPRLLVSETSTGRIRFLLGSNGIVAVQPVGKPPGLFFPDREEIFELHAPQPTKTNTWRAANPYFLHFDRCWYSGNALLYESMMYGGADYIVGVFLIDQENKRVSPGRICLEVNDDNDFSVQAAKVYGDKILFVGTHLFWENTGWDTSRFSDKVQDSWRKRTLRAFDLDQNRIFSGSEIPSALLSTHKDALKRVFGTNSVTVQQSE